MKKNIIWLSVLSFFCGLSGCSEQEDEGPGYVGNEIRIATHIGAVTRGDGVINPSLTGDLEVGFVRLDVGENNYNGEKVVNGTIFATDKTLRFTDETSDAYYPINKNAQVRLIGWYPNTGDNAGEFSGSASGGTVTFDIDGSTDIMVTDLVSGTGGTKFADGVTFNHVLSQVIVKVYGEEGAQTKWGGITSVSIKEKRQECVLTLPSANESDGVDSEPSISFNGEGDLLLIKEDPAKEENERTIIFGSISGTLEYGVGNPLNISSDPIICGYVMFAPTQSTSVEEPSENLIIQVNTVQGSLSATVPSYNFERGKKYVITLKLNAEGVEEPEIPELTDAAFFITGYENKTITVTLDQGNPLSLTLNSQGEGSILIEDKLIKTIQAEGASEILIGRRKSMPSENIEIRLKVESNSVVWRTQVDDNTTVLINTAAEMKRLAIDISPTKFIFESDIDLMSQSWTPVAELTSGKTVDGGYHKIYNLSIISSSTANEWWGLFKKITGGTLQNLHIASGLIDIKGATGSGTSNGVGTFVGLLEGGSIIGCSNSAEMKSLSCGGICGAVNPNPSTNPCNIIGCANYGVINANANAGTKSYGAGGICHYANRATTTIKACYNTGNVTINSTSNTYCAGIVGRIGNGLTISACYNIGTIFNESSATSGMGPITGGTNNGTNCFSVVLLNPDNNTYDFNVNYWPSDAPSLNWGKGDDSANGKYWSSVGGNWNGGVNPEFPKLYWETLVTF
ncbi:hypothetical protein EZS27_002419 [termite gut metagenome]|uniref:GLUG domain-containing protein n=1 Tax=termite gut metagenome TaxID=433724 RepID=A0A5J4SXU0_9ZZZZ